MCNTYWWSVYHHFKPWKRCPTRPDPGEVLRFYLRKHGISEKEEVSYVSDLLELQKSMVYNILCGGVGGVGEDQAYSLASEL